MRMALVGQVAEYINGKRDIARCIWHAREFASPWTSRKISLLLRWKSFWFHITCLNLFWPQNVLNFIVGTSMRVKRSLSLLLSWSDWRCIVRLKLFSKTRYGTPSFADWKAWKFRRSCWQRETWLLESVWNSTIHGFVYRLSPPFPFPFLGSRYVFKTPTLTNSVWKIHWKFNKSVFRAPGLNRLQRLKISPFVFDITNICILNIRLSCLLIQP